MVYRVLRYKPPRAKRSFAERWMVRHPDKYRARSKWLDARLGAESRLRTAIIEQNLRDAWSDACRNDLDPIVIRYAPDCVCEFNDPESGFVLPEYTDPVARGHDGMREMLNGFLEEWDDLETTPREIFSWGDRLLVTGHWFSRGAGSGIELESQFAQHERIEDGLVKTERNFWNRERALRDAGIDPEDYPDPGPSRPRRKDGSAAG